MAPAEHDDIVEAGRADDREPFQPLARVPAGVRRAALTVATLAVLALAARPYLAPGAGAPAQPDLPRPLPAASSPGALPAATLSPAAVLEARDRSRAHTLHAAQVRAVPAAYRRAADQASKLGGRHLPADYFLALAYNRTLYGALITAPWNRSEAPRGPLQWDLATFRRVAPAGHRDPTDPLDAFLALDAALPGAFTAADDAYTLSVRLGADADEARADAEAYDILGGRPG